MTRQMGVSNAGKWLCAQQVGPYHRNWGEPAGRLTTGRTELRDVLSRDWQNDYADLAANMKRELQRIQSGRQRAEAIARMRKVLEDYTDHRERQRERRHANA